MPRWLEVVRKLRGLLGVGTLGAVSGSILSVFLAGGQYLLGMGVSVWADVAGYAVGGALYGAACGLGFGLVLIAFESRRSILELPLWRMGLVGALMGAVVPIGYMLLTSGLYHFLYAPEIVVNVTGMGAALGGLVSSGMVALAQRAQRAELGAGVEDAGLIEGS